METSQIANEIAARLCPIRHEVGTQELAKGAALGLLGDHHARQEHTVRGLMGGFKELTETCSTDSRNKAAIDFLKKVVAMAEEDGFMPR